jgi:putative ABC transport system permease protein
MKKLNVRLWRTLNKTKGQFIAVAAVIAIGIASFVGMKMGIVNLQNTVDDYYQMTNKADLQVQLVKIPEAQVDRLSGMAAVESYNPRVVVDTFMKTESQEKIKLRVVSIGFGDTINSPYIVEGHKIKDPAQDIMVIETFAKARGIKVGDTIEFLAEGRPEQMTVCAIVTSSEYIYVIEDEQTLLPDYARFGVVFLDRDFVQRSFGYSGAYNEILVKVKDKQLQDKVKDDLEDLLDPYGVKRMIDEENNISDRMVQEEIAQGQKSSLAIPMIFLAVAAGIMVVMISRTVKNDRLAIGIFKAMGYSDIQVMGHYASHAVAIGMVGSIVGCVLGIYMASAIATMYAETVFNLPLISGKLYPEYLALAVLMSSVFCVGAGIWGARGILSITPAESMRPDAPKKGKRIWLEKVPFIWKHTSFTWKIVIRSLLRSKKRVAFLILGISMTFAITILPIFMIDEFLTMFKYQFGEFLRFDYSINFSRPVSEKLVYTIESLVKVTEIEPKVEVPFELVMGWRKKAVNVIGLSADTKLYHLLDLEGYPIRMKPDEIYISENLARYLKVGKGDRLEIRNYLPDRDDVTLMVGGIVSQKLGSNAYMERSSMNHHLLDAHLVTSYILKSNGPVKAVFSDFKNVSSVQSVTDMRNTFQQFMSLTYASLFIMLACAFVLGFAILYNSAIMSIHERTMEFSSLRVMGFDKSDIFSLITRENLVLAVAGIAVGIPLSMGFMGMLKDAFSNEMYTFGSQIRFDAFLYATITVIGFVMVSLLATYEKIQKLDFIEALKARVS